MHHTKIGMAGKKHKHVSELGLTMLAQAKIFLHYLWDAFSLLST